MGLFEAVCFADPYISKAHESRGDVVFLCLRALHAPLGEVVFTLLSPSYSDTGRGYNTAEAGIQTSKADEYFPEVDLWAEWQEG